MGPDATRAIAEGQVPVALALPMKACDLRRRGISAAHIPGVEEIVERVASEAAAADVVLVMSNGAFGGIHRKLLAALETKAASPQAPIRI